MGFTTPSYCLTDLFARAERGELKLPDFQRDYVWDIDRVRTLVTSVLRGFPVGSLLALDTRNEPPRFRTRLVPGVPADAEVAEGTGGEPGLVLLDGQQRFTSLYQAFSGDGLVETVDFLGRRIVRRFFVDIAAAAQTGPGDPIPVEAIFTVDETGAVCSHFGPQVEAIVTRADMIAHGVVPVASLLGGGGIDLLVDMAGASGQTASGSGGKAVKAFMDTVATKLPAYSVPVIRVDRGTSIAGIGQIFAHANASGVHMDVVDLLTAQFAQQDPHCDVERMLGGVEKRLHAHPVLAGVGRIEFLRAMSLVLTSRRGAAVGHRGDILNLSLREYREHADEIARGFEAAAAFLEKRCFITPGQVPHAAHIVSLAAILARLTEGGAQLDQRGIDRLNRWFWCGTFGELFGGHAPTIRSGADVDQVTPWVRGETTDLPRTVTDAVFRQSRLLSAGRESSVFRGLFALIMERGARDFRTGWEFNIRTCADLQPEFAQVFPPSYCAEHGVDEQLAASVLNRTPMGLRTKGVIERNGPKRYLPRLQSKSLLGDADFDAMLAGHQLNPALAFRSDHNGVWRDRLESFTDIIEYSMDAPVVRDIAGADGEGARIVGLAE